MGCAWPCNHTAFANGKVVTAKTTRCARCKVAGAPAPATLQLRGQRPGTRAGPVRFRAGGNPVRGFFCEDWNLLRGLVLTCVRAAQSWLDSESTYRLTVEKTKEAKEGAGFAQNEYEKWKDANKQAKKDLQITLERHAKERQALADEREIIKMIMRYIGVLHDVKASEKSIAAGGVDSVKDEETGSEFFVRAILAPIAMCVAGPVLCVTRPTLRVVAR